MEKILFASTNSGKFRELSQLVKGSLELVSPLSLSHLGVVTPKVEENGNSYFENSLKKAIAFGEAYQLPVLADDSGLEVDALNGAPGVHTALLGGEKSPWVVKWDALLQQLKGVPERSWGARFRCVLCYWRAGSVPVFFEGITSGRILPRPRGEAGFGFDPLFLSDELKKSFAEVSNDEKAAVSHRARAAKQFLQWKLTST